MFETILGIKKATFGLDIGYRSMKIAQVKGKGKNIELVSALEMTIPESTLNKQGIKDKEKLASFIKEAVKKAKPRPISAKIISTALPESLVFTKSIDVPKMTLAELNKNIPYQATEFFPIPAEETYMDWQVVGENKDKGTIEVLVVAAPKILVNSLNEAISLAGFEMLGLETKPVSVARALIPAQEVGPFLILDIGAKTTGLTCYDEGTIKLTSTAALGGDELTNDFANSLKALASEVIHLIKYYQNRIGQAQVFKKIILAGGGANVQNTANTLQDLTKIQVIIGQPLVKLKGYDPKFASALGLAMKEI